MFDFKEIENVVTNSGFELRNSTGSHHIYVDKTTGMSVTVPKHPKGVSVGVGEKVIKTCVLVARINQVNIGSYKHKFSTEIYSIIESHHAKCKENLLFLMPEEYRQVNNIQNADDVKKYLETFKPAKYATKKNFETYAKFQTKQKSDREYAQ